MVWPQVTTNSYRHGATDKHEIEPNKGKVIYQAVCPRTREMPQELSPEAPQV
ncbi:hypothetical protein M413DRAFT_447070 [Hebeloma cylindrosporum]|uniref:Uncharacterized protein n=1 Tax=Hebeloma cylindrosporum TaxID=76867 RepID=A0A0C2YF16_HEBCY|nr:hypothetical protein M413DRAFT_447070 [Hebeloma cylindrosporum h7]